MTGRLSSRSSTCAGGRSRSRAGACRPTSPARSTSTRPRARCGTRASTLYGLHLARTAIASAEEAIVVEGYTDVIGLVQAGYDNVVASMGTALTQPQLRELRKLARNVVLLFDADTAGSEAALRGLELAAQPDIDLHVRVALPPRGSDPAEVAAAGREAVDRMLAGARSVLAFRVVARARRGRRGQRRRARRGLRGAARDAARRAGDARARRARAPGRLAPAAWPSDAVAALVCASGAAGARPRPSRRPRAPAAWTPRSATSGCCSRSRSRAASAAWPCSSACPPEALSHEDLREAHAWVRARLNQDDVPSVEDGTAPRGGARGAGGSARGARGAGRRWRAGSSRAWIERRLEPLKEKLAAAEITPEEMRELAELQALARSAGGAYAPRTSGI